MLLYRLLVSIFALWVLAGLVLRRDRTALRQRLAAGPAEPGPHLWLHAASNGELASARPLVDALRGARPDLPLLVTCNSPTGVALAQSWGLAARLAPLDLGWVARRMHRKWQVRGHIAMESELWPHRVLTCPGPVFVMGGRLTEGTARGWRLFGALQRRLLRRIAYVSAQDAGSLARYRAAGLPARAAGPVVDLKALYTPETRRDPALCATFDRRLTWLAASTHEGEEEVVLAAHLRARAEIPGLRLILAPRHPRRAEAVLRLIVETGLSCARRSLGQDPATAEVYLADTMGEMGLLYPLAGRIFIGGTLTDRGGHTPYEPAAYGAALLHGPDVANFRAPFARLDAAHAALQVASAEDLGAALIRLAPPDAQDALGGAAQAALRPEADAQELVRELTERLDAAG
ncbi:3-deoxy-D-manno-octulosonic acid transferase [Salipiger sp. P9]|uniref:3-deoxy-D-manno-octulosonic acid transferase n=1 Tax=Salipiger pentaromativorans TaxID=2943193 RepID=UPI00215821CD|nr:glycosyltransferase N-terminal domain-containing protein [Salipiger pentaromativorans]MCR8547622.1 3-deoxy-D-manno-octulosonic acid transferase [Salipiger pentaromativorans]